jgi:predicted ATP-grasp superfamily ATP-dependent carboligase
LAVVRSLGRAGYEVFVQAARPGSLAGVSRFARHELIAPEAFQQPAPFLNDVTDFVRKNAIDLVIPITDAALQVLLAAAERLAPAIIPFGPATAHCALSDKRRLMEEAPRFSIDVPAQRCIERRAELIPAVRSALRFPVVLKPSSSVRVHEGEFRKGNAVYAENEAALERHAARFDDAAYPLLAQERIVGEALGVFLLMWNGRAIARFAHRRLRERPPSGGEMVLAESAALDLDLADRCESLLRAANWQGPAMVEFKIDQRTGTPYLMEVNARFWGSLQLAIDAGVDFPAMLADAALGSAAAAPPEYVVGQRLRWFWGDVDHLMLRLWHSSQRLDLVGAATGRLRALAAFTASTLRGERDAVFRWDDPTPFAHEAMRWTRDASARVARVVRAKGSLRRTPSAAPESVP